MRSRLYYRRLTPTEMAYLADHNQLVGHYETSEEPLDSVRRAKAFKTALEWFANLSGSRRELQIEDIEGFTRKHGLLRWNWTHEGYGGGPSNQFYLPVDAFRKDYKDFREQWAKASTKSKKEVNAVCNWLGTQLAAEPQKTDSLQVEQADSWKLSQPRTALQVSPDPERHNALEIRCVLGDLWQALCAELLDRLIQDHGAIGVCENERCNGGQPIHFIVRDPRRKYCKEFGCAKLVNDRKSARRRRARERAARKRSRGGRSRRRVTTDGVLFC